MEIRRFVVAVSLAFAVPIGPARCQEIDLAELERRALAESPRLAALRAEVARRAAEEKAAGLLGDPMLEVEAMDLASGGRPVEARLLVRQPLPPAGRRAAERQVAAATTRAAEDELAAEERALVGEIRRGWAEVWRLQEERRLLEEAHPLVELVVESAQARLAGGGERLSGVLDARAELRRHEIEQGEVEARWLEAQSRLGELAGFETGGAFPRLPELVELPSPEPELADAAAASPRVVAALAKVEVARAELGLARSERRAATSVGVGVRSVEGDGAELTLAGGVELPIFRRRRAAARIAAAEHALAAAEAEARGARLAVRGELERLYLERVRVERQLERLREGLLLESSASFEAARSALLDGTGSVADASHHLALWTEARLDESRLLAERFSTRAAIVALVADDGGAGGRP